jgi:hypothetical protein
MIMQHAVRNGVAAEFDAPVVLKAISVDSSVKNNYVMAEKNRGNTIDKKYWVTHLDRISFNHCITHWLMQYTALDNFIQD